METRIGIKPGNLSEAAHSLGKFLADEYILYTPVRKGHWNILGANCHTNQLFFESQYQQVKQIIDDIAERARRLGHPPPQA